MTPGIQNERMHVPISGSAPPALTVPSSVLRVAYGSELSTREIETLRYVSHGFTSGRIAKQLGLSRETIDSHRKNILRKLRVNNLVQAVAYSLRHKIIE